MYKRPVEIYECDEMSLFLKDSRGDLNADSIEPVIIRPKNVDKKAQPEPIRLSSHAGNYFHSVRSPSSINRQSTTNTSGKKVRVSIFFRL
jgi:hypothetical protein